MKVALYNEDCQDVLPLLLGDLCVTDPPYDLGERDKDKYDALMASSCSGRIVFSPPENRWYDGQCQHLFWIKPISTKNTSKRYSRFVELIQVIGSVGWKTGRHWSQYTNVFFDLVDGETDHPYEKPKSLLTRLILNHTKEGDVIVDPFMGSGTVGVCAVSLGRSFIGVERDQKHFATALERIQKLTLAPIETYSK